MIRAILICTLCMVGSGLGAPLKLVENGRSPYYIRVAPEAIPSERYAAEEFRAYIHELTGVELPVSGSPLKGKREVTLLGSDRMGSDAFLIEATTRSLRIEGGRPRGVLNGVYSLLEEQMGVRWFTPELEVVPRTNRLYIPRQKLERTPVLEYREVFWTEIMRDADFAARHRLNGNHYRLQEKHGGRFAVYYPFVHSFDELIPRDLYPSHPEYFPLIKGTRTSGYVQRCLSNPEVLKLAKQKVRQWIQQHPEATIISVSQNDTFNYCECPDCRAIDEPEGSPCASLLRFVNAIADDLAADFPSIRIDTLAYQYTRKPPRTIRPRGNVIIRLCSIECCFAHPLETCPSEANRAFQKDILNWQPVAPRLYIWDYTPNFGHYQQPFPNFDAIQKNVQFFVAHGVKGLFEQGNYSPGGQGEMGPLRAYLLAKLLWDPQTDLARHRSEFLEAYYGPAAAMIDEYLDLLQGQVTSNVHAHIFDSPRSAYLSKQFLAQANQILDRAEEVAPEGAFQDRVLIARLPVYYVSLARGEIPSPEKEALLARFLAIARKAGITHISESTGLEDWAKKQK